MNKVKVRKITFLALVALFVLTLSLAIGSLMPVRAWASGSDNNPFNTSTIMGYKEEGADTGYLALTLESDTDTKEYQRKLALKWYEGLAEDEAAPEGDTRNNPGKAAYFSMTFSLPALNFKTLTFTFSGTEENVSKEALSVNDLVFEKSGEGLVAYVVDASMQAEKEKDGFEFPAEDKHAVTAGEDGYAIRIDEEGCAAGEFNLYVGETNVGKLTNIGVNYLDYSSSTSAKKKPFVIKAELEEGKKQKILVKQISGQTFDLTGGTDGTADEDGLIPVTGGKITDNAPAVLVLNQKVYGFTLGQRFDLTYEVIDVCDNSVSADRSYYMLAYDENGAPVAPDEESSDDYKTLNTSTYFLPKDSAESAGEEEQFVSIRFALTDNKGKGDFIYLSWYAAMDADSEKPALSSPEGQGVDYIRVRKPDEISTPEYSVFKADAEAQDNILNDPDGKIADYQAKVTELAENLSAGDGAYFYLPSLRELVTSGYADYTDLRFSIYYYKPGQAEGATASSQTNLRYNNLKFEVDKVGVYRFRVLILDKSSNAMELWYDGKLTTVSSSNIWAIEHFPEFSFEVGYNGLTIEDAGEQTQGNTGSSYSVKDFTIVSLGDLDKTYSLYHVDMDKVEGDVDYSDFVEMLDADYFDKLDAAGALREIKVFNDEIDEDDEEKWKEADNDYHWTPGTTPGSFVPMEKGIYIVKLTVADPNRAGAIDNAYLAINVKNSTDITPGQIDWLQNNIVSVILFAIAAVLAVFILVLFFVKPPEKDIEDIDLDKLKGKKCTKNE